MTVGAASPQGSIIYLEDVTVDYDGFKALHEAELLHGHRELRVVIGPNGAGKTTLLDVISGKVQPTDGRVVFGKSTDLVGRCENEVGVARHRTQVPDAVDLREPDRAREPRAVAGAPEQGVFATLRARLSADARRRGGRETLETIGLAGAADVRGGRPLPRREAVARDRHGAWCRTPNCSWWTSRRRA